MAEKEERIAIAKMLTGLDDEGSAHLEHFKIYSRQEAINRMAKAASKAYRGYFYAEPHHPNISDMMEAALNALLEK